MTSQHLQNLLLFCYQSSQVDGYSPKILEIESHSVELLMIRKNILSKSKKLRTSMTSERTVIKSSNLTRWMVSRGAF